MSQGESNFRELLRSGARLDPRGWRTELVPRHLRLLNSASPFAGMFTPNDWRSYVEFEVCHSLPNIAGPAFGTGNYTGWHPRSLAVSREGFLHQQMNLGHLLKHHDPEKITHDRIVGCIVATQFPDEPEGGWQIPADAAGAIPIHCCAVVFKIADGALEMMEDHVSGRLTQSVSVEMVGRSYEEMGIYRPSTRELFPLLEAPEEMLSAITKNADGQFCLGKMGRFGEQLVLAYGGNGNPFSVQGVGFTPNPAERAAEITGVQLSARMREESGKQESRKGETFSPGNGVCALRMESANVAFAEALAAARYPGARVVRVVEKERAQLAGRTWSLGASAEDPVAEIRLRSGALILKRMSELGR